MRNNDFEGSDRRSFFRIFYQPAKRPKLIFGKHEFEIADISEGGIRLINDQNIKVDSPVNGTTTFLFGQSMAIKGDIVWEQNNQIGILLKDYIPPATMEREKQFVILDSLKNEE